MLQHHLLRHRSIHRSAKYVYGPPCLSTLHPILLFHGCPPRNRRWEAFDELMHVMLWYSVRIDPVPIPSEDVDNVLRVALRTPTERACVSVDVWCVHLMNVHGPCPQFRSDELGYRQERYSAKNHRGSSVQPPGTLFPSRQNFNLRNNFG